MHDAEKARRGCLERAGFNVFNLAHEDVELDFYTDIPPRSYVEPIADTRHAADSLRVPDLPALASALYGRFRYVATTKGRSAEMALVTSLLPPGALACGSPLFSSVHHALEHRDIRYAVAPRASGATGHSDLDVEWIEHRLCAGAANVVCIEPGTNAFGGLPMRLENARAIAATCKKHGATLVLDATRLLANCLGQSPFLDVVQSFTGLADAFTVSCAKELLVPCGGLVGVRTLELQRAVSQYCLKHGTVLEPNTARVALAHGMERVLRGPAVLEDRKRQLSIMAQSLRDAGVPFHEPLGGHAVYVAIPEKLLGGAPRLRALECLLYEIGGVRSMLWPVAGMPRGTLRLALAVGRYSDDELGSVGPRLSAFLARATEALELVDAPHEELSPSRARYRPVARTPRETVTNSESKET